MHPAIRQQYHWRVSKGFITPKTKDDGVPFDPALLLERQRKLIEMLGRQEARREKRAAKHAAYRATGGKAEAARRLARTA